MSGEKGRIFAIKRFAVHDGDGIRTTVFLKGCSLECVWCHNPEGISPKSEISYYDIKCISCGACASVCQYGAHTFDGEYGHIFHREKCVGCGECENSCYSDAIVFWGETVDSEQLLPKLLEDRAFFENSGGGVTISGGECLCQSEFCRDLLMRLKKEGIHTAVDTCGFISRAALEKVIDYTDIFLYDIKAADADVHARCTGHSNELILDNLRYLNERKKPVEIRIPYVPEYNSSQIEKIADILAELECITKVKVLPYHNYARSKYESLGKENTLPQVHIPTDEELETAVNILCSRGLRAESGRPLKKNNK